MNFESHNLGGGHILCLADSFDTILQQLSPDYFARVYSSIESVLQEFRLTPEFQVGWMHPGYACLAPDVDIPNLHEPGGLFGWVTQSPVLDAYGDDDQMTAIANCGSKQEPAVQWATCSGRLYALAGNPTSSWAHIHNLFLAFAVDDPTEWAGPSVLPNRVPPPEPWRQLVLAAATDDASLEQEAWTQARDIYTESAVQLLASGIDKTRQCVNW